MPKKTPQSRVTSHKGSLYELVRQIESAAEMEMSASIDVAQPGRSSQLGDKISAALRARLFSAAKASGSSSDIGVAEMRPIIRSALLDEINMASHELLRLALRGFQELCDAQVDFFMNTSNDPDKPEWGKADFLEFPFIRYHREMLNAVLRIRDQPAQRQMSALRMAHCIHELQNLFYSESMAAYEGVPFSKKLLNEKENLVEIQRQLKLSLPSGVVDDVNEFFGCLEFGSIHAYALPIAISKTVKSDDLRFIGKVFRQFGRDVRIPPYLRMEGMAHKLKKAQDAVAMYDGAGRAFEVLSAWVMATDAVKDHRRCAICYRHTSAIFRCVEHATRTQETREARLGKQVKPIFDEHFSALSQVPSIRAVLKSSLRVPDSVNEDLQKAAEKFELSDSAQTKVLRLAMHLRGIFPILNTTMAQRVEQLFSDMLQTVQKIEHQPPPVGDAERNLRERQKESVRELLSLKGFLKAWCGHGRFSAEVNLAMLGFDRDHPVALGAAIDSSIVQRTLLEQRAWEESLSKFLASNVPTAAALKARLNKGKNKKQVADELGISLATVYNVLKRGRKPRKRNFFGVAAA